MNFNWLLKSLPLVEGMIESSIQDHLSAIKELLTTSVFCFFPLFIGALSMVLNAEKGVEIAYFPALVDVVSDGELILYSSSILAPILFLVLNEPEGKRRFRERLFQGIIVTVLIFTCNFLYILKGYSLLTNLSTVSKQIHNQVSFIFRHL